MTTESIDELVKENPHHTSVDIFGHASTITWNGTELSFYLQDHEQGKPDGQARLHVLARANGSTGWTMEDIAQRIRQQYAVQVQGNYLSNAVRTGGRLVFAKEIKIGPKIFYFQGNF